MVHQCKESIDAIFGFRTKTPTEIQQEVTWLLSKDRFTCPMALREVVAIPKLYIDFY
jgi:hypothetical protein